MHITIICLGSRGDVVPYLALAQGLTRAGHSVRMVTFNDFEAIVSARGLEFHPVRAEMQSLLSGAAGLDLTESGASVLRMSRSLRRLLGPMAARIAEDLSHPHLMQTDLIVNQLPGGIFGWDLAEAAGVPMVMAAVMPLAPTRDRPMLVFPGWPSWVPGYNMLSHWLAYQIVWRMYGPAIRRWRTDVLGLRRPPVWGSWRRLQTERIPVLNGFSPHLAPPPSDWGAHIHTTGAWVETSVAWRPPEDLVRFIESGPAPIYVGFGSMPARRPEGTTRAVLGALERTGLRAVVHAGWGGLATGELPASVFPVDVVPYDWLFPQMAVVVHHGGSGTTHAGLRAGKPSVLIPFVFDQFYWGRRVQSIGAGPPPIPHRKLTAENLAVALDRVSHDDAMRRRAAELGGAMHSEPGVDGAVGVIEDLLAPVKADPGQAPGTGRESSASAHPEETRS